MIQSEAEQDSFQRGVINFASSSGGAVAQLGARLDGIEEVVGSNPIGSTNLFWVRPGDMGQNVPTR